MIFNHSASLFSIQKGLFYYQFQNCSKRIYCLHSNDMKLITDENNFFSLKVLASSYVAKVNVDTKIVNKRDFKYPSGVPHQLPLLEVEPSRFIFNSNAACRFLSKSREGNTSPKVDELIEWESRKIQPLVFPILYSNLCKSKYEVDLEEILYKNILTPLNSMLAKQKYLTGVNITAADTIIWSTLYGIMQVKHIKEKVIECTNFNNWFEHISSLEAIQKAVKLVTQDNTVDSFKTFFDNNPSLAQFKKASSVHIGKESSSAEEIEETEGPSKEDIEKAKTWWLKGHNDIPKPREYKHPILPCKGEKNILVTAALPYVNNVPHLGNIIGCILSADVYARYCRLRNHNILYICGTDEYGTATETKALAEGLTPKQICDKYNALHAGIYKWFNIQFDHFGRTTTPQQTKITQDIFWKVHKNGYLLEDTVDQLQCTQCNRFLADRFVEGTCPFCKYEDARGDQCDACGKLINAVELIKPRCNQCGSTPILKTSQHVFLNLPKIENNLKSWLKRSEDSNWTHNAKNITKAWIADGLKPRCITRDLKWGTPVPLEGYTDKVFYVWFDAPIGYLSITANYTDDWEKWWKNPDEVTLVQFMAKDNVPFHTVVFPSSLLAADDNFTILNEISATEYLNYEDDKFSKSRGVGVFGDHAESTGIPADIFRFYLLYVRPESQDSAFQWSDMFLKNNSELLNNLGNFVNRALMFLKNSFNSEIPELQLTDEEYKFIASVNKDLSEYINHLEKQRLRDGLRYILNISRAGNQYIQSNKPWVLVKGNAEEKLRAGTVIGLASNVSALLSILMKPYMPVVSAQLQEQLKLADYYKVIPDYFIPLLLQGHKIGNPTPLFTKLDPAFGEELKQRFSGVKKDKAPSKEAPKESKGEGTVKADVNPTNVNPVDVAQMEAELAQQADMVRKLKTEKASKDSIDVEVKKLLDLKKQLALAQGKNPDQDKSAKKGKKGKKK